MNLPAPRGPLSDTVFDALRRPPFEFEAGEAGDEDDGELTLLVLQQLSYRRFGGVDPAWEEEPTLLGQREALERDLERRLRAEVDQPALGHPKDAPAAIAGMLAAAGGPSLSSWLEAHGTLDHLREFVVHRAAYQLQEADPHSFAIPRLAPGVAKTALLELQWDEYGGHEPTEAHAALFRETMESLDLEPVADLDRLPTSTLRTNTLLNRLGRSRRLVGACLGHLAVFEMTSVEPMARYAAAVRRLLPSPAGTAAARFFDVHVAADGFHARVAAERLVAGFADQYPEEVGQVLFGAAAVLHVERRFTEHVLGCWEAGASSLRGPLTGSSLGRPPVLAVAS